jgi:hypothetical protein
MPSSLNGTGLTFNSGQTLNSPPVTSIATGNGLQGGTITTTGTLSIAAPSYNSVGSYILGAIYASSVTTGGSYAAGSGANQVQAGTFAFSACGFPYFSGFSVNLSGTWRLMGGSTSSPSGLVAGLFVRIA